MDKYHKTMLPDGWEIIVAKNLAEVESLRPVWEKLQKEETYPVPNADIDRFISIIEPVQDTVQPYITLLRYNGNPEAMVIGRVERTKLNSKIGYKTLLRSTLKCLTIVYGGLVGKFTDDALCVLLQELLRTLAKGEADVVLFNHIRTDLPIYHLITKEPTFFCRNHLPKIEIHRSMSVPGSIDDFYQSCSKKHRGNLRRYIRKIEETYSDRAKIVSYHQEKEMGGFIKEASRVSLKTYQEKLGSGLGDDEQTRSLLETAAKCGWLRAHVFYIGDEPCAFQRGLQYGKTYFLEQIGFDPRWKEYNVGTVLFLKVLEELCAERRSQTIDFGFGDADYKQSYGNKYWTEASVYIFARRLYPILINILRSFMAAISIGLGYVLNKIGIVGWIKRNWRNMLIKESKSM
jgi:hypothetical protein